MTVINKQSIVELNFELALADGQIIDSNFSQSPVRFTMGDGSLLPGFEEVLLGLALVMKKRRWSPPALPLVRLILNVQSMKREEFSADIELQKGLVVSFADANQSELPGVIASWDDQWVEVDFNHPLAGKDITFTVKIHAVT